MAAILLLLVAFTSMMLIAFWGFWHTGRIYTGVSVGSVPVGGLTRAEAYRRLNEMLYQYPLPPVILVHDDQEWPLPTTRVRVSADLLDAANRAYLHGRRGALLPDVLEQINATLYGVDIAPHIMIDQEALRTSVMAIAANIDRPGIGERRLGDITIAAQPGAEVDVEATVQGVVGALIASKGSAVVQAPLIVKRVAAPLAGAVASPVLAIANEMRPLVLKSDIEGLTLALSPSELRSMTTATTNNSIELDEARLRRFLEPLAAQIDRRPRDARLRFNPNTGAVTVLSPSLSGRALDVDATVAAVSDALANESGEAPLVIKTVAPAVDMNRIAEMGIRELVASGRSYFAGSSASRIHNIEVAAEQFEGVVIPPNGIFSFNNIVRDVSSANGFEDSLVIWGDRTAVGVGGGVCQVSTTVFRAAYEGGFPIVERYNHGYVVDWYGEPGMDATIFTPTVDFRFRNDTGAYLLIDPVVDSANGVITFNFYGTRPNRTVTVSKPEITDVVKPEAPIYTVDDSLATGQTKQVEWQKDGMTVTVTRTIVENGTTRTDTLRSKYQPWRAVYLVGPGTLATEGAQEAGGE